MLLKTQRRLLYLISFALILFAGGLAAWVWTNPVELDPDSLSSTATAAPIAKSLESALPKVTGNQFASYWPKPLRRPLYDPPPPPPKVVEKPPPKPIRAKLLATMIEPGNTMAMIELSSGVVVFRKKGEEIGADDAGVTILDIATGSIRLRRGEEETKLVVPGQEGK